MARTATRSSSQATLAAPVPLERIERCIYVVRDQKVMLDADLAAFYGVSTKRLNEQVKRNAARFPADFVFQLTGDEDAALRSQNATLNESENSAEATDGSRRGKHRKYRPYVFTEHGAIMAAAVLNSERAVQISILVVRAFVRLRQILFDHSELAHRIKVLEREFVHKTQEHEEHISRIYGILEELMNPPEPPRKGRIGFITDSVKPHVNGTLRSKR
jgi:phage regulator Rha-like protein